MKPNLFVFVLFCAVFTFTGCGLLPSMRIFQKKVDPTLAEKSPKQVEAERQGAAFIKVKSAKLEADPARQVEAIHAVAEPLSASLGEPAKVVTIEDKDAIIAALQKGMLAEQKKAEQWKAFAVKYAGQTIEGSGWNLAGWGGAGGIVLIVAACIFIPGFPALLIWVMRSAKAKLTQVVQGVEEFKAANPGQAEELHDWLSSTMDAAAKKLVLKTKGNLDETAIKEARIEGLKAAAAAVPSPAAP